MDAVLKWLVVGIGDITKRRVLPAILEEPRSILAGIVTRDLAKAVGYKVPAWNSLEEALRQSDAEAVYVATPVVLHAPQTIASLAAGRHVLCEKPMAMHYREARSMHEAAERSGRKLGVAYYRRMYPKVKRAKELIEAGAIGTPFLAEATSHEWLRDEIRLHNWRVSPEMAGGGPLYDTASHRIDLMNFLLGKPVRASGHTSTLVQRIAVEDNATVLIEYQNGARGIVDVRWHSRVARDEFRIRGTEGEMNLSPLNEPAFNSPVGVEEIPAPTNLHYPCIVDFVSAVLDGTTLGSSGATAMLTDWVTEKVVRSQSA
jgi:predicted dehydrogenase